MRFLSINPARIVPLNYLSLLLPLSTAQSQIPLVRKWSYILLYTPFLTLTALYAYIDKAICDAFKAILQGTWTSVLSSELANIT